MSSLLFDEPPLIVVPSLAMLLGSSDEAIILQQVHYWLVRSTNIRDGYRWVYNSYVNWQKQFPWMSVPTVKRNFRKLEKKNLLVTANYNQAGFDKTKWYRINYLALDEMKRRSDQVDPTMVSTWTSGVDQFDPTNTIDYQENTQEITSSSSADAVKRSTREEEEKLKLTNQIRLIAKSQDFDGKQTLPTAAEWRNVKNMANRLSIEDLKEVILIFKEQMEIGMIDQPYRYLLKMLRDREQR